MAVLTQATAAAPAVVRPERRLLGLGVRLFLTCWLLYGLHFSPFVYRELYLAMSLAEKQTVRVDEYVDLHPDLFEIPGRGAYMGGNPGASFLAAVPYWLALPVVNRVAPVRPRGPDEAARIQYKEQRTLRQLFYRKVRERGLDIRLGLAAAIVSVFFMAPLAALSAVVLFRLLLALGFAEKPSLWLTLLYAFGTPIFYRAPVFSYNLVVTLLGFFSFVLLWWPGQKESAGGGRLFLAGLLAGWTVFTDYTGVVSLGVLGLFAFAAQWKNRSFAAAARRLLPFVLGALIPVAFLLLYQWYCFGNPWLPSQYHMPKEVFRDYPSERGFGWPLPAALWGLLFDSQYGLLVFAPIFALALYHPVLLWRRRSLVPPRVALFSWVFFVALWLFCSCIHYTIRHAWHDGVRYLIPAVPFLFLLLADVLVQIPRAVAYLAALAAVFETWCLAMVRENPMESILRVTLRGLELPWLTTLVKAAPQYLPMLEQGASPLVLFLLFGVLLWGLWRVRDPWRPSESG